MQEAQIKILDKREQITSDAVTKFHATIPATQKELFARMLNFVGKLERVNGVIKPSTDNLKKINYFVHVELKHLIRGTEYAKNAKDFIKVFGQISGLTNDYFKQVEEQQDAK